MLETKPIETLDGLVAYLRVHPFVAERGAGKPAAQFLRHDRGCLWFRGGDGVGFQIPVDCGLPGAAGHPTTIAYRPDGFDVTKFGVTLRYDYAVDGPNAASAPAPPPPGPAS